MGARRPRGRSEVRDLTITGYARVAFIDAALVHLDREYTYAIPSGMSAAVGALVRAPVRGRRRTAVVTAMLDEPDVARTVPIVATLGPGLDPQTVDLARWVAARYLSTIGEALAASVPERVAGLEERIPEARAQRPSPAGSLPAELEDVPAEPGGRYVWRPSPSEPRGEVCAELAARAVARGDGVLVLVPEMAVRGSVESAVMRRLGGAAVRLGPGTRERYASWLALRSGRARVAIGSRSAVFAPVPDLRLILIDDESHAAYKEGRAPRFHARTVAAELANRTGATIVLVGLPPSVEARTACARRQYTLRAPARATERANRPAVTVIDDDSRLVPAARTLAIARDAISTGGRAIVLVHRSERFDEIAARAVRITGARAAARLRRESSPDDLARAARSADLIVSTPYVSKDLDVPGVRALCVVEADAALAQPEFRAAETAFATWWRAARWVAGRDGKIAIETHQPAHPALVALARWDADVLWRAESARRKELGYPPFASIARIDSPASARARVEDELGAVAALDVVGSVERGEAAVTVVRATQRAELLRGLAPIVAKWRETDEPMRVDVDPWEVFTPKWRS